VRGYRSQIDKRGKPVRKLISALVFGALLVPDYAFTLGMGEIEVNSALNQQLDARIELLSSVPEDAETLIVKLASRDEFITALRTNYYNSYLIIGDKNNLQEHHEKELREHIYYGQGIVSFLFENIKEEDTESDQKSGKGGKGGKGGKADKQKNIFGVKVSGKLNNLFP